MQRIFADNGETPLGAIRKRRISEACLAIERRGASRKSIAEIAYSVGFLDPAYFSRVFRNEMDVAPTDYVRE